MQKPTPLARREGREPGSSGAARCSLARATPRVRAGNIGDDVAAALLCVVRVRLVATVGYDAHTVAVKSIAPDIARQAGKGTISTDTIPLAVTPGLCILSLRLIANLRLDTDRIAFAGRAPDIARDTGVSSIGQCGGSNAGWRRRWCGRNGDDSLVLSARRRGEASHNWADQAARGEQAADNCATKRKHDQRGARFSADSAGLLRPTAASVAL